MNNIELAKALFEALENNDSATIKQLCDPKLQAFQNLNPPMNLETLLAFTSEVKKAVPDFHYENPKRYDTPNGFVEEHFVCGTLPDGSELKLTVCIVAEVQNGKILTMREYVDTLAAHGLAKAIR